MEEEEKRREEKRRGRGEDVWRGGSCGQEGIGGSGYQEQVRKHEECIHMKEFDGVDEQTMH